MIQNKTNSCPSKYTELYHISSEILIKFLLIDINTSIQFIGVCNGPKKYIT